MTAALHLRALLQRRQWELDAAATQLRGLQQQVQSLRQEARRMVARRRGLVDDVRQPHGAWTLDTHQRRLLSLLDLDVQADRLQAQVDEAEAKLAQAGAECARRQLQVQGLHGRYERLQAALRMDSLRRLGRDVDAEHLVRSVAGADLEGEQA